MSLYSQPLTVLSPLSSTHLPDDMKKKNATDVHSLVGAQAYLTQGLSQGYLVFLEVAQGAAESSQAATPLLQGWHGAGLFFSGLGDCRLCCLHEHLISSLH